MQMLQSWKWWPVSMRDVPKCSWHFLEEDSAIHGEWSPHNRTWSKRPWSLTVDTYKLAEPLPKKKREKLSIIINHTHCSRRLTKLCPYLRCCICTRVWHLLGWENGSNFCGKIEHFPWMHIYSARRKQKHVRWIIRIGARTYIFTSLRALNNEFHVTDHSHVCIKDARAYAVLYLGTYS